MEMLFVKGKMVGDYNQARPENKQKGRDTRASGATAL
jgi:hypothetical protein